MAEEHDNKELDTDDISIGTTENIEDTQAETGKV